MTRLLAGVLATHLVTVSVLAQQTQTEIERLQDDLIVENARSAVKSLAEVQKTATTTKRLKCMMAFGNGAFCDCLSEQTPVLASFERYVSITTQSKKELGYVKLDKQGKAIVDNSLKARDVCVAKVFRAGSVVR